MTNVKKAWLGLAVVMIMTGLFAWCLFGLLTPEPQEATSVHYKNGPTDQRIFSHADRYI